MKKITIITGHYGSGKTNISANLAFDLARQGERVTVVDLDIVNPYFRTADFTEIFAASGIETVLPQYANTNLDIPAISFDLERIATDEGYLIIDVGGDDAGAVALGRYAEAFRAFSDKIDMLYVINGYRYLTREPEEALSLMYEIEEAARMKHTGIINNSNLGEETTVEIVKDSLPFAEKTAAAAGLPLLFTALPDFCGRYGDFYPVKIYVKQIWQ